MSQAFRLTRAAELDVTSIADFIAADNEQAALRLVDAFDRTFEMLARMPEIGHKREDLTDRPVRFWSVYSYLVVYDPESKPLSIIAVIHGARDVPQLLKDG